MRKGETAMSERINDLMKKIVQKNLMLDSIQDEANMDEKELRRLKMELDSLLYQYYKSLRER